MILTVNTLNDASSNYPKPKTDVNALVYWIEMCLFFIVLAMLEFAFLLVCSMITKCMDKGIFNDLKNKKCSCTRRTKTKCLSVLKCMTNHLDKVMIVIFPTFFFIYALSFWRKISNVNYKWINKANQAILTLQWCFCLSSAEN